MHLTALMLAAQQGHLNIVKLIAEETINNQYMRTQLINALDRNGFTAFYHAASKGKLDVVKYFIEQSGMTFNPRIEGMIALSLANKKKHNDVVQYLITKGVSALPKQDAASASHSIFYNSAANKHIDLDYFDTLAYTTIPIAGSPDIPSLTRGGTLHIYQPRFFEQVYREKSFLTQQLKIAEAKLGGTEEKHLETSPIFGGSCSYHAVKNALVGLMLLQDYDALAQECAKSDTTKIKYHADLVAGDINNFTALKTPQFDCADFMEQLHAKIVAVQHQALYQPLEALNIQQAGNSERMHIARHFVDETLTAIMTKRHPLAQKEMITYLVLLMVILFFLFATIY